jgi:Fe-S oxidoreductase
MSPNKEYIQIENHTDKEIFIIKEFNVKHMQHRWQQTIDNIDLIVEDNQYLYSIYPGKFDTMIKYYPNYRHDLFSYYYKELDKIPIMEKITAILKTLIIADSDGNILFTLDELKDDNIRKEISNRQNYYKIEIFPIRDKNL